MRFERKCDRGECEVDTVLAPAMHASPEDAGQSDGETDPKEENEPMRIAADPMMPTQSEVEEHRITHIPYRNWCEDCVLGRATGEPHRTHDDKRRRIPVVGLDYFFMTKDKLIEAKGVLDIFGTKEKLDTAIEEGQVVKCLLVRCSSSKAVMAFVVTRKGVEEDRYSTDRVVAFLQWLGHTRMLLRSDNENPITALVKDALKSLRIACMESDSCGHPTALAPNLAVCRVGATRACGK